MNDHTVDPLAFFAVQVRVVKIGDSPLLPVFEVLERPSARDRKLRTAVEKGESELTKFRREFWNHYANQSPNDGVPAGYGASSWWLWIESAELNLSMYVAQGSVGIWVRGRSGESAEEVGERIEAWRQSLHDELGIDIGEGSSWGSYANSRYHADTRDRGNWPAIADWLHNKIADYRRVLEQPPTPSASNDTPDG